HARPRRPGRGARTRCQTPRYARRGALPDEVPCRTRCPDEVLPGRGARHLVTGHLVTGRSRRNVTTSAVTFRPLGATSSVGPGLEETEAVLSLRAMHGLHRRDQVEVTHAVSWPEFLGVADGPGLALRKLDASRCRDVGQALPRAGFRARGVAARARL